MQWNLSPLQVAGLYKNRWQVELFFKWFKQHLKIKKFWNDTENAVRIQIYCKRLLNYILCIRFISKMHSIVSASQFSYTNLSQGCF